MTIKELRKALSFLDKGHDDKQLVVWLPGSKIDLDTSFMLRASSIGDEILVEGNLREGSALCVDD